MNRDLAIGAAVVNDAAEHITTRDPLVTVLVIFDLLLAGLDLDDSLNRTEASLGRPRCR
jgi:hypothetical protein